MRRFSTCIALIMMGLTLSLNYPTLSQQRSLSINRQELTLDTARELYSGPGETYRQIGMLDAGAIVLIEERNTLGTWLRITQDETDLDAWMLRSDLKLDEATRFSQLPITTLRDANPGNVEDAMLSRLYAAPILPGISPLMREVYALGQRRGSSGRVVTKVGDSLSANPYFLMPLRQEEPALLGPYDYLADVLEILGPHIPESVASRVGLSSRVVFDPFWAQDPDCRPNESPLVCEYRLNRPSFALILFGPNDVRVMDAARFTTQMERIVTDSLAEGVIPILYTFSCDPSQPYWLESLAFNQIIIETAEAHQVPLVNLWAASRSLPRYGLDRDFIHLRQSGYAYLKYDSGLEARSGVSLLNLLTLHVLDSLIVALPIEPDS